MNAIAPGAASVEANGDQGIALHRFGAGELQIGIQIGGGTLEAFAHVEGIEAWRRDGGEYADDRHAGQQFDQGEAGLTRGLALGSRGYRPQQVSGL